MTADIPDPYPAFLPTTRIYRYLKMLVRLGQVHGIDTFFPYRQPENLVVLCPASPRSGHIMQHQLTLDGNFHTGHFAKNCDPNDISLCNGKAQFPPEQEYRTYLKNIPVSKEKSTCVYLKANIDFTLTYDIACEYYVKIKTRFRDFPELVDVADLVDRICWDIPALHVTGHKADCPYLFGTAYMDCVGHFHGETAEAYWPSANKIGGHARQMNNGHRQDTLIDNANDWNWKKTIKMHVSLYDDLSSAKKLLLEKRKLFIGLSAANSEHIEEWQAMPRQTTKDTPSAYHHTASKVPSQTAIYQHMLANLDNFASTHIPTNEVACFLQEGLKLQDDQRKIKAACAKNAEHTLQATTREIATRHTKLGVQLHKWCEVRDSTMPKAADIIAAPQACEVELETLWLPSDFTKSQRVAMGRTIIALAAEESKLREGQAYNFIRRLQTICKGLSALEDRKTADNKGQKNHTISGDQVLDTKRERDDHIAAYNSVRKAMISLGTIQEGGKDSCQFPHLTITDTFMKSRRRERALGDSRRGDGMLYTRIGIAVGSKVSNAPQLDLAAADKDEDSEEESEDEPESKRLRAGTEGGTQMTRKKKKKPAERRREKQLEALTTLDANPANKNGWLWELRRPSNMSDSEMLLWEREGDRVQWARAEAEMDRFQEQLELKLTEFLRCIAAFQFEAHVWTQMGADGYRLEPGFQVQAKETAHMWTHLAAQCQTHLEMAGYAFALDPGFDLIAYLEEEHHRNDGLLQEQGIVPQDKRAEAILFARARGEKRATE
ncbi:hypothetical protein C8R44DRAFT_867171 [Mycena epipterygia]|nr:hypothetical protein C8R44DRAFT_867171 [Mycena epipterygia]